MKSLAQVIAKILSKSKTPMVNSQIRAAVAKIRPYVADTTVDATLSQATKKGLINKTSVIGLGYGKSKFAYSVDAVPSVISVVENTVRVRGTKIDSLETFLAARSVLPKVTKHAVDGALFMLTKNGRIAKSKNPMTDVNAISSQSKFLYSIAK